MEKNTKGILKMIRDMETEYSSGEMAGCMMGSGGTGSSMEEGCIDRAMEQRWWGSGRMDRGSGG